MELYARVSYMLSRQLTLQYSSSFGLSSRLFASSIRADIYAIYGLVRIADEIVDTYTGKNRATLLNDLEAETRVALTRGYSTNPIVHAFSLTATRYGIGESLLAPFFASMRIDLTPAAHTSESYHAYIYGSAEVIGLMCLRIFCLGNDKQYEVLAPSARSLGSAYQKINFLRDITADYNELGRMYFPGVTYDSFSAADKQAIVSSIHDDLAAASSGLKLLPNNSKAAVMLSVEYYSRLLSLLERASVAEIKTKRLRITTVHKLWLLVAIGIRYKVIS